MAINANIKSTGTEVVDLAADAFDEGFGMVFGPADPFTQADRSRMTTEFNRNFPELGKILAARPAQGASS